jgi:hypothetical protein
LWLTSVILAIGGLRWGRLKFQTNPGKNVLDTRKPRGDDICLSTQLLKKHKIGRSLSILA